jgi:hypothetical protein|tara:strand:- start:6038 stop:6274 length:237 start_codon:yes stop_codon:yes gene_type:complete
MPLKPRTKQWLEGKMYRGKQFPHMIRFVLRDKGYGFRNTPEDMVCFIYVAGGYPHDEWVTSRRTFLRWAGKEINFQEK